MVDDLAPGFSIGVVMDDIDEQRMGRLWVYIPGLSPPRSDPKSLPMERVAPINDSERSGWVRVYPLLSFFGADDYRESPNFGRIPKDWESNSYGFWYQPRIGDEVGVLFNQGDPAKGYWIGCKPKQYCNFMVPGHAADATSIEGGEFCTDVGPAHDKNENLDVLRKPSLVFYRNLAESGLLTDPIRGAGSTSARRESPSRVTGIKTPGDPDTGMMGHQIAMDDHPDHQGMRFRTSKGAQVYLNDTCDMIYISTQKGNVWLEFEDTGRVHIHAEDSISIHTMKDYNLVVEKDMNMEVRGDLNWLVKGNTKWEFQKQVDWRIGEELPGHNFNLSVFRDINIRTIQPKGKCETSNDINIWSREDTNILAFDPCGVYSPHVRIQAKDPSKESTITLRPQDIREEGWDEVHIRSLFGDTMIKAGINAPGSLELDGQLNVNIAAHLEDVNISALQANVVVEAANQLSLGAVTQLIHASGLINVRGGALANCPQWTIAETVGIIPPCPTPPVPIDARHPQKPVPPEHAATAIKPKRYSLPGPPASPFCECGANQYYVVPLVPQHEPWTCQKCAGKDVPVGRPQAEPNDTTANEQSKPPENEENPNQDAPPEQQSKKGKACEMTISDKGLDIIKRYEGFSACRYSDLGVPAIGYGHRIKPGENIGQCITKEQADAILRADVQIAERCLCSKVTADITQEQYDGLVSLAFNTGCGQKDLNTAIRKFNEGNVEGAYDTWGSIVKGGGRVLPVLQRRRAEELRRARSGDTTTVT